MNTASPRRSEDAVSSAVATVLLFGGVVAIISMMMVTMLPVIQELEGAVERSGMSTQMESYATETVRLSESGMPGDSVRLTMDPLQGRLEWNNLRGGIWMAATWQEGQSMRIQDALDLDDDIEIRYPEGEVGLACFTDLRLGLDRPHIYRIPAIDGELHISSAAGLADELVPIRLTLSQGSGESESTIIGTQITTFSLPLDGQTGESWLRATADVEVLLVRGQGGATVIPSGEMSSTTDMGRIWDVPIPAGTSSLSLASQESNHIEWSDSSTNGAVTVVAGGGFFSEGATWTKTFTVTQPTLIRVSSSAAGNLLLTHGSDIGSTPWPSETGALRGVSFLPPAIDADLIIDNPGPEAVLIRTMGGALSVPAGEVLRLDWPPSTASATPRLTADDPVILHWSPDTDFEGAQRNGGLYVIPAVDTGRSSGHSHVSTPPLTSAGAIDGEIHFQVAGVRSNWSVYGTEWNETWDLTREQTSAVFTLNETDLINISSQDDLDPLRVMIAAGDDGMMRIAQEGAERCQRIDVQASGWIQLDIPWEDMSERSEGDVAAAWRDGRHPSSFRIDLKGTVDNIPHSSLASAWAFHMPRFQYGFESSISGLEVATRGGAVVTNHPETQPSVLMAPSDRSGPGPRFSATVPLTFPTSDSVTGSAQVDVGLTLIQRFQLSSSTAHEVRRGWEGPYGPAVTAEVTSSLSHSSDWMTFPHQLNLLDDYKGWVPDPTPTSDETVFHTNGEPIRFTLQVSILHHSAQEVI